MKQYRYVVFLLTSCLLSALAQAEDQLQPIKYNNPGLVVDLGVGLWAWPLPMDYDGDGDLDLVVNCPDVPFAGTYFFENPGLEGSRGDGLGTRESDRSTSMPVFKAPVRIADKVSYVQLSDVDGRPIVSSPGKIYLDFPKHQYSKPINLGLPVKIDPQHDRIRANQWKLVDWENDGDLDLIVGVGVWDDYGWDDAWDADGNWKNGPLHGYVYLVENIAVNKNTPTTSRAREEAVSTNNKKVWKTLPDKEPWPKYLGPRPKFAEPRKIEADGKPVDVYGMPSPNFADFDGDGDLDLICGEFMDGFTSFENVGDREHPQFAAGERLVDRTERNRDPLEVKMDLQMITPVAIDWDGDGDVDLICGDEDGRVAFIENMKAPSSSEPVDSLSFSQPVYIEQHADDVIFGALVTPVGVDWDGDGDEDIVCGNTAGYIAFIENLGGESTPSLSSPQRSGFYGTFRMGDIRHQAGPKGSIQGPCEAKWGYTTLSVADWDHDGQRDVVINDIWGKVGWHQFQHFQRDSTHPNVGGTEAVISAMRPVRVDWQSEPPKPEWVWWTPEPGTLTTQWRTTPFAIDWNQDGLTDLVMLDHEGYLVYYERNPPTQEQTQHNQPSTLKPPQRIFKMEGHCEFDNRQNSVGNEKDGLLRLNAGWAGKSGRRKLHFVDWDGDGRLDLLVNSENVNWLKNVRTDEDGFVWFKDMGKMDSLRLAGHTTSPTTVDWDNNGIPDLLVGAEDGRLYFKKNPRGGITLGKEVLWHSESQQPFEIDGITKRFDFPRPSLALAQNWQGQWARIVDSFVQT